MGLGMVSLPYTEKSRWIWHLVLKAGQMDEAAFGVVTRSLGDHFSVESSKAAATT